MPWAEDAQLVYEHYHRYLWARQLVDAKTVIDLGSGEGFGSALLATRASQVIGIDIDRTAVEHATLNYPSPNLSFRVGSALDLRFLRPASYDVVVAFELIEHLDEQERALAEIKRVLKESGFLILSTPERNTYNVPGRPANPFHARELSFDEFTELLGEYFSDLAFFGQRPQAGSLIEPLSAKPGTRAHYERITKHGDEWALTPSPAPVYLLAIASDQPLDQFRDLAQRASLLADPMLELRRELEHKHSAALQQLELKQQEVAALSAELERLQQSAASAWEVEKIELKRELDERVRQVRDLVSSLSAAEKEAAANEAACAAAQAELARVRESVTWRLLQGARTALYRRIGYTSTPARVLQFTLRTIGRLAFARSRTTERADTPLEHAGTPSRVPPLTPSSRPVASLIVPVHNQQELTARCLEAIAVNSASIAYEIIVVDDGSGPQTRRWLERIPNIRLLRNESPAGFLKSVNWAAEVAAGKYLVILNNDTEPREGWLEALVERAESDPTIGAVGSRLVYPDGRLQEAGGIVWSDGTAWNFGHGDDPNNWRYLHMREVDYASAAALLVRADAWRKVGGFDERYAPCYYEDTDLCFALRDAGYRVVYEPRSVVVHVGGATHGVNPESGLKRYQTINRHKFSEKWAHALRDQPSFASAARARYASDRRQDVHVLYVDHRLPTWDRDAGSLRAKHIIDNLTQLGARVTVAAPWPASGERYAAVLRAQGVEVLGCDRDVVTELRESGHMYTHLWLSRPQVAAGILHEARRWAQQARIIYDTVDLHFVRERRRIEAANATPDGVAEWFLELECALAKVADVVVTVTQEERDAVIQVHRDATVVVVPNAHEVVGVPPPYEQRDSVLFIGSFEHEPNVGAALRLVRNVMPRVWKQCPNINVEIVGADPPREVAELAGPRVTVCGWVPDVTPLLNRALCLAAPLRFGAGLKGKVTQALAHGVPVVTTPIGAEGIAGDAVTGVLVAETDSELAAHLVTVSKNRKAWLELSGAAVRYGREHYSLDAQRLKVEQVLTSGQPASFQERSRASSAANTEPRRG